jgi:hypothetical protein
MDDSIKVGPRFPGTVLGMPRNTSAGESEIGIDKVFAEIWRKLGQHAPLR